MDQRGEIRGRVEEETLFTQRAGEIKQLLTHEGVRPILDRALSFTPTALDLFTGTGAGIQALYEALSELGKPPREVIGVDNYEMEGVSANPNQYLIKFARDARYAWTPEETQRNLDGLTGKTSVRIVKANALDFLNSDEGQIMIGITTGFAVPLGETDFLKLISALAARRYHEGIQMPVLLTFGTLYSESFHKYMKIVQQKGLEGEWNFYRKPKEFKFDGWDQLILTNHPLNLPKFSYIKASI